MLDAKTESQVKRLIFSPVPTDATWRLSSQFGCHGFNKAELAPGKRYRSPKKPSPMTRPLHDDLREHGNSMKADAFALDLCKTRARSLPRIYRWAVCKDSGSCRDLLYTVSAAQLPSLAVTCRSLPRRRRVHECPQKRSSTVCPQTTETVIPVFVMTFCLFV